MLAFLLITGLTIQWAGQEPIARETPRPPAVPTGEVPTRPVPSRPELPVVYLSDIPWERATTGWIALADDNKPKLDASFRGGVLTIGEKSYDKGIGTFPLSEIVYKLDGGYRWFNADIGMDSLATTRGSSLRFRVFLDDALAFQSELLRAGMEPVSVALPLTGVDRLKLVVEDPDGDSALDYADWADARLTSRRAEAAPAEPFSRMFEAARDFMPVGQQGPSPTSNPRQFLNSLRVSKDRRQEERNRDWATVQLRGQQEVNYLASFPAASPSPGSPAEGLFDAERGRLVLSNSRVAVLLGYGGEGHGLLDIVDRRLGILVAFDVTPSVTLSDASILALSQDTLSAGDGGHSFRRIDDPALGRGTELTAEFPVRDSELVASVRIVLFDDSNYLTYRLEVAGLSGEEGVRAFSYFDPRQPGAFVLGEDAVYLTDYSLPRGADVRDDSVLRRELVGLGKPVLLRDGGTSLGLLMGVLDQVDYPALFTVRMDPGRVRGQVEFAYHLPEDARGARMQISPRLFLQLSSGGAMEDDTAQFRQVMSVLYPPLPMPDWVKYQWGTWYAFYMNYNEDVLREHIDYIADNLADLGPWSILLDAGWYVAEGRPDSGWDSVDPEKFPDGLRPVVDYAHSRGIKVVLYFSAPYLDDREREGNWLGLKGFVEEHPDWVIPLQADATGSSYVYDFTNPELVEYLRGLIRDFFQLYDVDGIKIDGLGQAEGERLAVEERDSFGDVNKIRMFTMDAYRLIHQEAMRAGKDVYIESGWAVPNYANHYAHTFRYGDEFPEFRNRYPAGGLVEHIDYASLQKRVLGQRPNMGMVWGGPESQGMIRLWFEAALAMGTQMTLSTDLTHISPRELSALRAVLVHYNAFQGETRFLGAPFPESFATTSGGMTYLGAMNREEETREATLELADYGLDSEKVYLLYDVASNSYTLVKRSFSVSLAGNSFRLFLLRDNPGMVWTNSSFQDDSEDGVLRFRLAGPRTVAGFAQLSSPLPIRVRLDGRELIRSSRGAVGNSYWYDDDTGVLRVRYRHDRPHTLEVDY